VFYKGAMGQRSFAALVFGMAIVGVTASAGAQQAPAPHVTAADLAAAKRHYAEGERKLHADKYEEALAEFKAANDIKTTPQAEKNIGVCEDKLGHYAEAVEWYEKFLAHVPAKLAAMGDEIQKRTDEIKAMSGKVHFETDPNGATVTVDDKPEPGVTPVDVDLAPGRHDVKFTEEGRLPGERSVAGALARAATPSAPAYRGGAPASTAPAAGLAAARGAAKSRARLRDRRSGNSRGGSRNRVRRPRPQRQG
jgi:tetratricopeptide (TPR) repeat protein